jgi:hypothetical protein
VWFLAPTVALCEQQHKYIQARLPSTSPLLLTGSSNVDYWSTQKIWDAALHNHQIVVSTHAVLRDAMQHAFVQLASLALLVFDEGIFTCNTYAPELTQYKLIIAMGIMQPTRSWHSFITRRRKRLDQRTYLISWAFLQAPYVVRR